MCNSCFKYVLKMLMVFFVLGSSIAAHATMIDLTVADATATLTNAIVSQSPVQPAGSGVFESFVRIGDTPSDVVEGYNTTAATGDPATSPVLNTMSDDNFSHAITLGDVALVNIGGTDYREFLLDINESNSQTPSLLNGYLSLDEIQIFMGGTANSAVDTFTGSILDHDGTLVWNLDALDDNWIALNYALESGSGESDMVLHVANSLFSGYDDTSNLVLYSMFGMQGAGQYNLLSGECNVGAKTQNDKKDILCNFGNTDGYEEWASHVGTPNEIPEPQSLGVFIIGLIALTLARRRQQA